MKVWNTASFENSHMQGQKIWFLIIIIPSDIKIASPSLLLGTNRDNLDLAIKTIIIIKIKITFNIQGENEDSHRD